MERLEILKQRIDKFNKDKDLNQSKKWIRQKRSILLIKQRVFQQSMIN